MFLNFKIEVGYIIILLYFAKITTNIIIYSITFFLLFIFSKIISIINSKNL